jgi:Tfp pilus assembly protein PilE
MQEMTGCKKNDTHRGGVSSRATAGYTLMETAIVMAIVGLLIAAFASAHNIHAREKARSQTISHAEEIMQAINRYVMQSGHYPCPAPQNVTDTDPRYGVATNCDVTTDVAVGACNATHGYCVEESGADTVISPEPGAGTVRPRVRRGVIPFRTLGIAEKYAYDGQGMRFLYAVTENLAVPASAGGYFMPTAGGVGVYRGSSTVNSLVNPAYSAHFILFSAGANRMGAYNRHGNQPAACATGSIDWQNCNTSTSAANRLSRYAVAPYSTQQGTSYFDDYVRFYTATELPSWRAADGTGAFAGIDVRDSVNAGLNGVVGIGDKNPAQPLSVQGDVLVEGKVFANRICNENGSECFEVPTNPGTVFDCPGGEYVSGFEGGRVRCRPNDDVRCPPGQHVRGVSGGRLVCGGLRGCPRKVVDVCFDGASNTWQTAILASSTSGTSRTPAAVGHSRSVTYLCTNGEWDQTNATGQCSCENNAGEQRFYSCDRAHYLDNSAWPEPGGRYTGSLQVQYTRTCPAAGVETINYAASTCRCDDSVPTKETRVRMCPNGANRIVEERTWSCPSATSVYGEWSAWAEVVPESACNTSCTVRNQEEDIACPTGFRSTDPDVSIRRRRTLSASCTWGAWSVTQNNCTDCVGAIQSRNIGCENGVGSRLQTRTFDCGATNFGSGGWSDVNVHCVANPTYRWRATDTSSKRIDDADLPAGYRVLGDTAGCAAANAGEKSACYFPAGGATHWELQCACE